MAKKETWYGKTEEEVRAMDFKQFLGLIPSRERRSLKRGISEIGKKLIKELEAGKNNLETHCRDMVIVPIMLGKTIKVHNGKEYVPVMVTIEMLGHRLGEFSQTRKWVTHSSAGIGATRSSKGISAK
jgi:small subunit ribosomal protein S19